MSASYDYYDYEGYACRVALRAGKEMAAELYRPGEGFVQGPLMQITTDAKPITKQAFDAMVLGIARQKKQNP